MKETKLHFIPAILWLIISTILLTLPGSRFPKEDWLSRIWFDKWVHVFLFGLLTWLWCMDIPRKTKRIFIVIGIYCLLYGTVMEFVQGGLIPNRSFDTGDIIADAAGCFLGVVFSYRRYIKK